MREVWGEENLVQKWFDDEVTLVAALAEQGIVPQKAARKIAATSRIDRLDVAYIGKLHPNNIAYQDL